MSVPKGTSSIVKRGARLPAGPSRFNPNHSHIGCGQSFKHPRSNENESDVPSPQYPKTANHIVLRSRTTATCIQRMRTYPRVTPPPHRRRPYLKVKTSKNSTPHRKTSATQTARPPGAQTTTEGTPRTNRQSRHRRKATDREHPREGHPTPPFPTQ